MNTVYHPISKASTFGWLLKREYWEHRGGFLWAPLIAGAISLLMSTIGILLSMWGLRRAAEGGHLHIDNSAVSVNGLDLRLLTERMDARDMENLANALDFTLLLGSLWPFVVLAFVVFFYCLGALYDDRRDRSILFWQSLPLSNTHTVLSKVVSALVVAPVIAVLASIVTMFGFALILSCVALAHGGNPMALIWGPASPLSLVASHVSWLPVYAVWALPTVGWLLMWSAWAKSKPFLWGVMLPIFAGIIVSTTKVMQLFDLTTGWFWQHVVGRLLLGTLPGSDVLYRMDELRAVIGDRDSLVTVLSPTNQLAALQLPEMWIGAAFGVVFILIAIRLRRCASDI